MYQINMTNIETLTKELNAHLIAYHPKIHEIEQTFIKQRKAIEALSEANDKTRNFLTEQANEISGLKSTIRKMKENYNEEIEIEIEIPPKRGLFDWLKNK